MALTPYVPHQVQDNIDRVVAADHNNQETQLVELTNNLINQMQLNTQTVLFGTVAAGVATKVPIFVAPFPCVLNNLQLVNALSTTPNALNNTRLDLVNMGGQGIGVNVIATFNGASDAFTAYDAFIKGITNVQLNMGDVLALMKSDIGTGGAVTGLLASVSYSPVPV